MGTTVETRGHIKLQDRLCNRQVASKVATQMDTTVDTNTHIKFQVKCCNKQDSETVNIYTQILGREN